MKLTASIIAFALAVLQQETVHLEVELQQVVATVRYVDGRLAKNLRAEDFVVEEDGVQQTIAHFEMESGMPASIGILIDNRRDVTDLRQQWIGPAFMPAAIDATRELLKVARQGDEFLLMTFHDNVEIEEALTENISAIESRLKRIRPTPFAACRTPGCYDVHSRMNLIQAVDGALKAMGNSKHRKRALIVISAADGESRLNGTSRELTELGARIRGAEIGIFGFGWQQRSIAVNPEPDLSEVLNVFDVESGSQSLLLRTPNQPSPVVMANFLRGLSTELRSQYRIGYYPPKRASANPTIKIRTASMEYRIKASREASESNRKR
jgi:hypothetical protein